MAVSRLLSARIRAVLVTGIAGAAASHIWTPWSPGTSVTRRIAFAAMMFLLGAGFGAIDATLRDVRGTRAAGQATAFGALSLGVALLAYALLH